MSGFYYPECICCGNELELDSFDGQYWCPNCEADYDDGANIGETVED